ncbi:MAG: ribosome small subunit-dependent GTPase A [Planctomycetes bacterium]|nr:ribosome small subunit-dependent GTPase A [Planctomycetota bacterium]
MKKSQETANSSKAKNIYSLPQLGWSEYFHISLSKEERENPPCGRIALTQRGMYHVLSPSGRSQAVVSGSFRHNCLSPSDFPTTGDWVIWSMEADSSVGVIHEVLPRKSKISRKGAGATSDEQLIATNIDWVVIVTSLDENFSRNRIERYLAICQGSGAKPVVVMNKADLTNKHQANDYNMNHESFRCPIVFTSAISGLGIPELRSLFAKGDTLTFVGSSGVGKSSLINELLGDELAAISEVRTGDSKGRHTTTSREMYLSNDLIIIDTPGMRELQLSIDEDRVKATFSDIETYGEECQFTDCTHIHEPGCAVREAIEGGEIDAKRFDNFSKQLRETQFYEQRSSKHQSSLGKKKWKDRSKIIRNIYKDKEP